MTFIYPLDYDPAWLVNYTNISTAFHYSDMLLNIV